MALLTPAARRAPGLSPRRFFRWWALLPLLLAAGVNAAPVGPAVPREYQIKAVFLYNFAQFIAWPAAVFAAEQTAMVIGVLGEDPFGRDLEEAIQGETAGGHALEIRRYRRIEEVETCHILFISRSETGRMDRILARLKGRTILTVSDAADFAARGGMIGLVTESSKVRMRINLAVAETAGLTISSKLLRPAMIVTTTKDR